MVRFYFFFQAEDGIRDLYVTGVQTCAFRSISSARELRDDGCECIHLLDRYDVVADVPARAPALQRLDHLVDGADEDRRAVEQIGRASCRERVEGTVGVGSG